MINSLLERLSLYWETFSTAPLELQLAGGSVALGAGYLAWGGVGKLWKLLTPVRWIAAKLLQLTAFGLYRNSKKIKAEREYDEEIPFFNCTSKENLDRTLKYYGKGDRVKQLSDESLDLVLRVAKHLGYREFIDYELGWKKSVRPFQQEVWDREHKAKYNEILENHNQPTKVAYTAVK